MLVIVIVTLYPMYYVLIVSISNGNAVMRGEIKLLPKGINLTAYKLVFENPDFLRSYLNTIIYTLVGTIVNVSFTILCAYPLSRKDFYGRGILTGMVAFTMFFSGGMIPLYLVVQKVGLINSMWALILPVAINTWYMIIMRTFFQAIPESLQESAYIDGANDIQILIKVILPLSLPIIATLLMFYAVYHWNSYFSSIIYLNQKKKYPVQIVLRNIVIAGELDKQNSSVGSESDFQVIATNFKYAVIIISVLPILTVYPFIQKYFTQGVMVGAIKG